jgi:hypothetical protein
LPHNFTEAQGSLQIWIVAHESVLIPFYSKGLPPTPKKISVCPAITKCPKYPRKSDQGCLLKKVAHKNVKKEHK